MKNNFGTILLIIFGLGALAALGLFALSGSSNKGSTQINVTLWGTLPQSAVQKVIEQVKSSHKDTVITYVQKDSSTYADDLVEALASGNGPDLMILPQQLIWRFQDKIYPIPAQYFSERQLKDTFVQEGEIFFFNNQLLGLPVAVDPMVMYWNRDMLSAAGFSEPPKQWDELYSLAEKISQKDSAFNLTQSAVAFGQFDNVSHAKDILAALIMQAGGHIISQVGSSTQATLYSSIQGGLSPADSSLTFFTEFSNPAKTVYSWNKSQPLSQDAFIAGNLALYFGYASEVSAIRAKNPNLNFDVAPLPQAQNGKELTFGNIYAIAALKSSKNLSGALGAAFQYVEPAAMSAWTANTDLPPVRRDMLATKPADPYQEVFYDAALVSDSWLDPDSAKTDAIFQQLIQEITTGQSTVDDAVNEASNNLNALLSTGM